MEFFSVILNRVVLFNLNLDEVTTLEGIECCDQCDQHNIFAPQAHFRKVTVHVVGKSGCVLHDSTTGARAVWGALAQNEAGAPMLGYLPVELDRFHWPGMLSGRGSPRLGCRELTSHAEFMGRLTQQFEFLNGLYTPPEWP